VPVRCKNICLSIELKESKVTLQLNFGPKVIFGVGRLKQPIIKIIFWCRSVKTNGTKNESSFLVSARIIDRHHFMFVG
jgi:hypothetical protein